VRITYWIAAASGLALTAFVLSFASGTREPSSYNVLYKFAGSPDGASPQSDLTLDAGGNLYGTTFSGGAHPNYGTVFELKRANSDWQEQVLYSFSGGNDGGGPVGGVTFDKNGNLYGTTSFGGPYGETGTVFELSPNSKGGWNQQTIYQFSQVANPNSNLLIDSQGNLYGTTGLDHGGAGLVFELSLQPNGTWTEATLHAFIGKPDGAIPSGALVMDQQGNLYGMTQAGGTGSCAGGCGLVYELTPGSTGWTESILYSFPGGRGRGRNPSTGLTLDDAGALYGTTWRGGDEYGVLFKLAQAKGQNWQEDVLYQFFGGIDGWSPVGRIVTTMPGILFGAAYLGGSNSIGTVFEVHPGPGAKEKTLHAFAGGADGKLPMGGVTSDGDGTLYGTTSQGGNSGCNGNGCGTVYQLKP
jgi:uncharacterized repeat protein (TIGR03803 family)